MKGFTIQRRSRVLIGALVLAVWALGTSGHAGDDAPTSSTWSSMRQNQAILTPDSPFAVEQNRNVFRQSPALTGRFEFNDQTFFPFIGAGFGGGYTNDRDRALGSNGLFSNPALSGELGRNMMPNEFNLGLRIPF
jgi:hypothetical protein